MSTAVVRCITGALCVALLPVQMVAAAAPAHEAVELRAYVDDTCIIADEPFFLPADLNAPDQSNAKFLPLL
jgi:hypothetical protein